uniref:non-specific serine/threonine protein kinase n=1 Tax=Echinostoma caproni TaxID=27848 RepID=A0A183BAR5_9TREM
LQIVSSLLGLITMTVLKECICNSSLNRFYFLAISGYRLTNLGYDYLALHQLFKSGQLVDLRSMIGTGKESDTAGLPSDTEDSDTPDNATRLIDPGTPVVVKFHRLGRTSFRKVKEKREYHQHRNTCSWLYLDRLASQREFSMMKALYDHGLPVPTPLAHNRNAVVMSYVSDSLPMARVMPSVLRAGNGAVAKHLYMQARDVLHKISSIGLIHGDFNEFNLMLVLIDFPQMISRDHETAESFLRVLSFVTLFLVFVYLFARHSLCTTINRALSYAGLGCFGCLLAAHLDEQQEKDREVGSRIKEKI